MEDKMSFNHVPVWEVIDQENGRIVTVYDNHQDAVERAKYLNNSAMDQGVKKMFYVSSFVLYKYIDEDKKHEADV
jgi:hypothetical protein